MKNKTHNIKNPITVLRTGVMITLAVTAAALSCTSDNQPKPQQQPLVFSVVPMTRAANYPIEDYFSTTPQVLVTADGMEAIYLYNDGLLEFESGDEIVFPADGQPLNNVTVEWPSADIYSNDQSTKDIFMRSDNLVCRFEVLMPASVIPVEFNHENYKLTFQCGKSKRKIIALSISDGADAYNSFCDPDRDDAQLILLTHTNLSGLMATVNFDGDQQDYYVIIPNYSDIDSQTFNQSITVILPL